MLTKRVLALLVLSIALSATHVLAQTTPPIRIACIGDSITFAASSGEREETSREREGDRERDPALRVRQDRSPKPCRDPRGARADAGRSDGHRSAGRHARWTTRFRASEPHGAC